MNDMPTARSDGTQPQDDAAAKMNEILEEIKRTGRPVINDPSQAIINTKGEQDTPKGNAKPAFITLVGPALGLMNRLGDRRLAKSVEPLGRKVNRVQKVRALVKKGTKTVFVWETFADDSDGIDVKRSGSYASINLWDLLSRAGLTVESGHYETYALEFSEPTDMVYPAIKFDMSKKVDSGLTSGERLRRAEAAGLIPPKAERAKLKKGAKPTTPGPELKASESQDTASVNEEDETE
jgi:hypothetical protein